MKAMGLSVVVMVAGLVGAGTARAASIPRSPKPVQGVVNLNTAAATQLELLPGVGKKTADRIVAYRQKQPFHAPEEVSKVKGVGEAKMKRVRDHLAISGPTTLVALKTSAGPAKPAEQGRTLPPGGK